MAEFDLLFRMRRKASIEAFNDALPASFKLLRRNDADTAWISTVGVHIDPIATLDLVRGEQEYDGTVITTRVLSSDFHANIRVTPAWSGWSGLFIEQGDPDYDDGTGTGDPRLDNSKIKRWFKNNGVERLDNTIEHPRSGRADMRWWRWSKIGPTEWVDVTIDKPQLLRRVWA